MLLLILTNFSIGSKKLRAPSSPKIGSKNGTTNANKTADIGA